MNKQWLTEFPGGCLHEVGRAGNSEKGLSQSDRREQIMTGTASTSSLEGKMFG